MWTLERPFSSLRAGSHIRNSADTGTGKIDPFEGSLSILAHCYQLSDNTRSRSLTTNSSTTSLTSSSTQTIAHLTRSQLSRNRSDHTERLSPEPERAVVCSPAIHVPSFLFPAPP